MNCKPHDLCRIVRNEFTVTIGAADRFISVTHQTVNGEGDPSWRYEGAIFFIPDGDVVDCIPDRFLRPINNPGEDETDEMVLLVGIPEGAPA